MSLDEEKRIHSSDHDCSINLLFFSLSLLFNSSLFSMMSISNIFFSFVVNRECNWKQRTDEKESNKKKIKNVNSRELVRWLLNFCLSFGCCALFVVQKWILPRKKSNFDEPLQWLAYLNCIRFDTQMKRKKLSVKKRIKTNEKWKHT